MSYGDSSGPESPNFVQSTLRGATGPEYAGALGSTEVSGSGSNTSRVDSTIATQPSNSASEDERFRPLVELEACLESFRRGKVTKTSTISSVIRILGENTDVSLTPSQKEASFDSYLAEILAIQSAFDDSNVQVSGGENSATENLPVASPRAGDKRVSRKDGEVADSESEDDSEQASKKRKLLESDMPWFTASEESGAGDSNPSCQETRRLLRAYNRDISKAKFYVKIAQKSPVGIPSSQWERIFKGDAVDLNQVFASLHHVIPDEERTARLGDTEISFGVAEAKKKIRTAAEWTTAWRRASKAIGFAFPHRCEELLEYGDYIESEFAAKLSSSHHKILLYDVALRNEVAAGQNFLLTDTHRFLRLYSAIVMPDGVEGSTTQPAGANSQSGGVGKAEICNKFNLGTCKQSDSACKYRHLCKGCKKAGHAKKDCPEGSK